MVADGLRDLLRETLPGLVGRMEESPEDRLDVVMTSVGSGTRAWSESVSKGGSVGRMTDRTALEAAGGAGQ
jgi:hypothetical protein